MSDFHWADEVAEKLLERGKEHVIASGTSISGVPHVGNASDVIRADAVRKALINKKANVELIWIADDGDPFRKTPRGMESLKDYLGFPVHDIPDPEGCHKNFVDHFAKPFIEDLEKFGVEPKVYSGIELYRAGAFNEEIKVALEKRKEIRLILNKFRKEDLPEDYIPWSPICEGCGRISTTKPTSIDGTKIDYVCEDTDVSGTLVKGCGHKGVSDASKGEGKLPWRVEWAARWRHFKVTCEPFGKEHATVGGSYDTSKIISKEIFDWMPPYPVTYEFFTLNGEKISSSKGNVITLNSWLEIAEPEVLKYFMYKRLQKQRDIKLDHIPNMTDEYDLGERVYFKLEEESVEDKHGRMYELAQVNESSKLQVPYTLCAVLAQLPNLSISEIKTKIESMGYKDFNVDALEYRIKVAGVWLERYGPEHLKFKLADDSSKPVLDDLQVKALSKLVDELGKKYSPEEFHKVIYQTARSLDLKPNKLFEAIYLSLINQARGPKAAALILSLDNDFVKKRFTSFKQ